MIITCPSCSTKFSVSSSTVPETGNPKFHCSRCDHIFTGSEKHSKTVSAPIRTPDSAQYSSLGSAEIGSAELGSASGHRVIDINTAERAASSSLKSLEGSQLSLLDSSALTAPEMLSHPEDERDFGVLADWPESSETYGVNLDSSVDVNDAILPSTEAPIRWEHARNFLSSGNNKLDLKADWPEIENAKITPSIGRAIEKPEELPKVDIPTIADLEQAEADLALKREKAFKKKSKAPKTSKAISPLAFLSVPLCLLLGLAFWSNSIENTPYQLASLLKFNTRSLAKVAPGNFNISSVDQQEITLQDGTKVLALQGTLTNGSKKVYRDAMIQASVYDSKNKKIDSVVVPANNKLVGAELSSINKRDLSSMQKKTRGIDKLRIGESRSVRVVLTDLSEKAAYVSARVYSVR